LTVALFGAQKRYAIDTSSISASSANPVTSGGDADGDYGRVGGAIGREIVDDAPQSALGAEATPYARLWHGSPVLGSGWSERFALYEDASFIWGASQMDGATRLRFLSGTWDVRDGNLTLLADLAICWEGGEVVKNTGIASYVSDEVILNPTVVILKADETIVLPVSRIVNDVERGLDAVTINKLKCWDYDDQAFDAMDDFWQSLMTSGNGLPESKDKTAHASRL
jgi:hypothetical protein